MEPFEIRSIPAKLGSGAFVVLGLFVLLTLVVAWEVGTFVLAVVTDDQGARTPLGGVIALFGLGLIWFCVRLLVPQAMVMRRYFFHDRGKQVLTFQLDQEGWRWLQVGTHVLLPWEGMRIAVAARTEDRMVISIEQPKPVRVADDPLSRQLHRSLKRRPVTLVPFTLISPTEDELAAAIAEQSGGRVELDRSAPGPA